MINFVLVHGAWHDGSAWNETADFLRKSGHVVFTPTIAGHGKDADKSVKHAESVKSISDFIASNDLNDVVLVGHSYGGTIISKVAEQIPERIKRLVFQNAFVVNDGESLNDSCPPFYKILFDKLAEESSDYSVMLPFNIWREAFINDAPIELAKSAYEKLSPEPYQFNEKLDLKKFYELVHSGKIPCSYLNCTEDIAMPHGEFCWHPRMSGRLGLFRLVQMPGSHEIMFTNPSLLAEKLIQAGRE